MERLTKKISKTMQDKYSLGSYLCYDFANADDTNKLLNKLGKFEDFMEKNDLQELEQLQEIIERDKFNHLITAPFEEKFIKPKKVIYNKFNGYRGTRFKCPNCNKAIENCIDFVGEYHCKHCGQSVVYPKFRVVNNVGELYFDEDK